MAESIDDNFIREVNQNLGIAHKVVRIYFINDQDDREDVLQEMMYQLWKSYPHFDGRSKFSTWMYSVCLNTALTYKRKLKKEQSESLSLSHEEIVDPVSSNQDESVDQLFNAISSLSPLNKAIILLYLDELSYDEIATITGLSKSNVSVRLVRIKRELEMQLKDKI